MELHPVTITIGFLCTCLLAVLVAVGLGCSAYKVEPDKYQFFKPYYQYAQQKKVC